jgi:hypothetical protein
MKSLYLIPFGFLLMSFTHPFAQDGSVDNDREQLDERVEKARRNERQEERAEKVLKEEQQSKEKIDRKLEPDVLLQDKKEGSL